MSTGASPSPQTVSISAGSTATAVVTAGTSEVCGLPKSVGFVLNRSFVEPTPANQEAFGAAVARIKSPDQHRFLFLVGHTDITGSDEINQPLSQRRARAVLAVFQGDAPAWESLYQAEGWGERELEAMVRKTGEATAEPALGSAVARYRAKTPAARDERAKLFGNYFKTSLLGTDPPKPPTVDGDPALGCGSQHLLRGTRDKPSRNPKLTPIDGGKFEGSRRVELFFARGPKFVPACADYSRWTLECGAGAAAPSTLPKEWFVGPSGQDAVGAGLSRQQPFRTIQFALDQVAVVNRPGPKVITILDGVYVENLEMRDGITLKADQGVRPTIQGHTAGNPILLSRNNQTINIEGLIIDGRNQNGPGIVVEKGNDVQLTKVAVQGCRVNARGGGILIDQAVKKIVIHECTISRNFAHRGGGVAIVGSSDVTIKLCTIADNRAGTIDTAFRRFAISVSLGGLTCDIQVGDAHGGGLFIQDSRDIVVRGNTIRENVAILFGGGIAVDNRPGFEGAVILEDNVIVCNQTAHAGPIAASCQTVAVGDPVSDRTRQAISSVALAIAPGDPVRAVVDHLHGVGVEAGMGGGIALRHVTKQTRLVGNTIGRSGQPNRSRRGGGIECYTGAYPDFERNTVEGNRVSDDGGGIAIDQFDPFVPQVDPHPLGFARGPMVPRQDIRFVDTVLRDNRAESDGGGLYATGAAQVVLTGSGTLVERNIAGENGGGLRASYAARLTVRDGKIVGNVANQAGGRSGGGGVSVRNADLTLVRCELSENRSVGFAGGAVFCNTAAEGGWDRFGQPPEHVRGQFDDMMAQDFGYRTRRFRFTSCRGSQNTATGASGAGGFLYIVHDHRFPDVEPIEVTIEGTATAIGANTSEYSQTNAGVALRKQGNIVLDLSGESDVAGNPRDSVVISDVPPIPVGIAVSTPSPGKAVAVLRGNNPPDDVPITLPYSNRLPRVAQVTPAAVARVGGTVLVSGTNFLPGIAAHFGSHAATNIHWISETEFQADAPPLAGPELPGPVDLLVINPDGRADLVLKGFMYF